MPSPSPLWVASCPQAILLPCPGDEGILRLNWQVARILIIRDNLNGKPLEGRQDGTDNGADNLPGTTVAT
jgi:hypothetical protein